MRWMHGASGALFAVITVTLLAHETVLVAGFSAQPPSCFDSSSGVLQCRQVSRTVRVPALRMKEDGDATKVLFF